eukprot:1482214-Pyramimonas_sp.AAC.1
MSNVALEVVKSTIGTQSTKIEAMAMGFFDRVINDLDDKLDEFTNETSFEEEISKAAIDETQRGTLHAQASSPGVKALYCCVRWLCEDACTARALCVDVFTEDPVSSNATVLRAGSIAASALLMISSWRDLRKDETRVGLINRCLRGMESPKTKDVLKALGSQQKKWTRNWRRVP